MEQIESNERTNERANERTSERKKTNSGTNEQTDDRIETNEFNANKRLPKHLIIETAGYHLYAMGITNQQFNNLFIQKRNKINNPIMRFILQLILLIRGSISIFITNKEVSFYIGNYCAFIPGVNINGNLAIISGLLISMISQMIHFWYSKKGIHYLWYKPFQMICGIKSPKSIGMIYSSVL